MKFCDLFQVGTPPSPERLLETKAATRTDPCSLRTLPSSLERRGARPSSCWSPLSYALCATGGGTPSTRTPTTLHCRSPPSPAQSVGAAEAYLAPTTTAQSPATSSSPSGRRTRLTARTTRRSAGTTGTPSTSSRRCRLKARPTFTTKYETIEEDTPISLHQLTPLLPMPQLYCPLDSLHLATVVFFAKKNNLPPTSLHTTGLT